MKYEILTQENQNNREDCPQRPSVPESEEKLNLQNEASDVISLFIPVALCMAVSVVAISSVYMTNLGDVCTFGFSLSGGQEAVP